TLGISTMKAKASLYREAFLHLSLGKTSPYSLLIPISRGFILLHLSPSVSIFVVRLTTKPINFPIFIVV
ncbi:hypothetical protein, partial [Aeromonas allosaccharophila]|uniref:hypothetical protein n=1 Tax=Aeromonas allosaccharophila TaxID=656 RepID=UPI001E392CA4